MLLCLLFDAEKLNLTPVDRLIDGTLIVNPNGPYPVKYTKEYLKGDPLNKRLNSNTFLTTKFRKWNSEKEFRFISARPGYYRFAPDSLRQIIFGLRIQQTAKAAIKTIISDRYGAIKFRRVELKREAFALMLVDENNDVRGKRKGSSP